MKFIYYSLLFLLASCGPSVTVTRAIIDKSSLASTFVRSPDPLQKNTPNGERLFISWTLPLTLKPENHYLVLSVIYKDLTEEKKIYPIHNRYGTATFDLLDDNFKDHNGFYAYQAELQDTEGMVIDKWEHQMWVSILNP